MSVQDHQGQEQSAIRTDLGADFRFDGTVRSGLADHIAVARRRREDVQARRCGGRRRWAAASASPSSRRKAAARTGRDFPIIVIQEAGLDGFWIHRVLESEGIESHVVDAASILTSRRRRRAKTDRIDGETLVRTLMAYKRGEPRVCSMARAPTPEEEDRRRVCRERKTLVGERVRARQPDQGSALRPGGVRLRAAAHGSPRAAGRAADRRWPTAAGAPEGADRPRAGPAGGPLAQLKAVEAERDALLEPASDARRPRRRRCWRS